MYENIAIVTLVKDRVWIVSPFSSGGGLHAGNAHSVHPSKRGIDGFVSLEQDAEDLVEAFFRGAKFSRWVKYPDRSECIMVVPFITSTEEIINRLSVEARSTAMLYARRWKPRATPIEPPRSLGIKMV
jgi:hypothetical protein